MRSSVAGVLGKPDSLLAASSTTIVRLSLSFNRLQELFREINTRLSVFLQIPKSAQVKRT